LAYAGRTELRDHLRARWRTPVAILEAQGDKLLVAGLVGGFLAISVWWTSTDERVPNGDNAKHTLHAFSYLDQLQSAHFLFAILHWTHYPPLVHVVGAVGAWVGGASGDAVVLAENIVFVPLLALGCYGAGRVAFGRLAGVLAVVFVFGAPMIISLFHVFMLDAPGAAVAALSVWFLLASRRFESLPWTVAAAVAVSAGMYVKATFIFFVAGLALALLLRGGWRHWRNAGLGSGLFLILVEPWYFAHLQDLRGLTTGAIQAQPALWYGSVPYPDRWSIENFTWYWWSLVNTQLYLPLTAIFLVGAVHLSVMWFRARRTDSYVPELLASALFAYLAISALSLDDPRYILPGIVYLAVIAGGWIASLPPTARIFGVGVLCTIVLVNTTLINYVRTENTVKIALPGTKPSPIGEHSFVVFSNRGYIEGRPQTGGVGPRFVDLLRRAREDGARQVVFQPESLNTSGYNLDALTLFARYAGLEVPGFDWRALGPNDIYVFRIARTQANRPACLNSFDETGIYMVKGQPAAGKPIYCPRTAT